jgi:cell division protein FtsN
MSKGAILRSSRSSSHQNFARAEEIDPYHEGRHDEELRNDPPRRRWRRRFIALTLVAVGIYAYRTYYVEPGSTQTPQVIMAGEMPSKVTPAISDPQSGKFQDQVGARRSGERMVSGEQPVEPVSTGSTPRWAWPSPPAPSQLPPQGAASATDTISSDPKRIATLVIRPDGTEASGQRVASPPPGTSASAAPSQAKPVQPATRGAALDPRTTASDPAPAPPAQRPLTPPAPRLAATPAPAAAANAAAGGYFVQVSSQRSEADAQAYFRSLQEKFPSQLEGRTAIIRRADLGAKGIYYRVVTGPFASPGEADLFCSSLKAAGGTCIIQRN